jgi:membrane-bound lytic murein transglycosylase MltF
MLYLSHTLIIIYRIKEKRNKKIKKLKQQYVMLMDSDSLVEVDC